MSDEVARIVSSLRDLTSMEGNPYTISYSRKLAEVTDQLEVLESGIAGLRASLANEEATFAKVKDIAPELKKSLKSLSRAEFAEIINLIGSNYDLSAISSDIEGFLNSFVDTKSNLIESHKEKIREQEAQRGGLSTDIAALQDKIKTQEKISEQLNEYIKNADNYKKGDIKAYLAELVDKDGNKIFLVEEINLAANIILSGEFSSNDMRFVDGVPISRVITAAKELPEEEPEMELESVSPIIAGLPTDAFVVDDTDKAIDDEEEEPFKDYGPSLDGFVNFDDGIESSENALEASPGNPYDLISELAEIDNEEPVAAENLGEEPEEEISSIEPKKTSLVLTPEGQTVFGQNVKYLGSVLGLYGNPNKFKTTLSMVSIDEIEKMIKLAKSYGFNVRNIGNVVKLCSSENVKESFEQAIRTYGKDYSAFIKSARIETVLGDYKLSEKKDNGYLVARNLFPGASEIVDRLNNINTEINENDPKIYIVRIGLMEGLEKSEDLKGALEIEDYLYLIGDQAVSKPLVSRNLTKLLSLNLPNSNEELMLMALAYDSELSPGAINEIKNKLNTDREEKGMVMAA